MGIRTIIFRGKRKDNDEWIDGGFYLEKSHDLEEDSVYIIVGTLDCVGCAYEVIPETVGQYTGLTDKNGKKIFEGDILKAGDFIFVVNYGKCGGVANADNYGYIGFYLEPFSEGTKLQARYGLRNDICYFDDNEIIGNIHDNPELLEGERESDR